MKNQIAQFLQEEDGATALEYALIAGLVTVAVIAALAIFSDALQGVFTKLKTSLDSLSFTAPAKP